MNSSRSRSPRSSGNTDPRAVAARARIVAAYAELVEQGGSPAMPVGDLLERAGVTRSTFYAHFTSIGDVAVEVLSDELDTLALLQPVRPGDEGVRPARTLPIPEIVKFIDGHRAIYDALLVQPEGFTKALEEILRERHRRMHPEVAAVSAVQAEVSARFVAAGIAGVIGWWVHDDTGIAQEELAAALAAIMRP